MGGLVSQKLLDGVVSAFRAGRMMGVELLAILPLSDESALASDAEVEPNDGGMFGGVNSVGALKGRGYILSDDANC